MGFCGGGLLPRAPAFDEARGHGEGCFGDPELLILDDAGVAAEAAPTKMGFCGGPSLRTPVFDEARGHDEGCSGSPKPLVVDDAGVAAEAAPTKNGLLWGAFAPNTRLR